MDWESVWDNGLEISLGQWIGSQFGTMEECKSPRKTHIVRDTHCNTHELRYPQEVRRWYLVNVGIMLIDLYIAAQNRK